MARGVGVPCMDRVLCVPGVVGLPQLKFTQICPRCGKQHPYTSQCPK